MTLPMSTEPIVSFKDLKQGCLLQIASFSDHGIGAYRLCDSTLSTLPCGWAHRVQIGAGESLLYLGPANVVCGWRGWQDYYPNWWACLYLEHIVVVMADGGYHGLFTVVKT